MEILRLYDELRRRHKTIADFERLMVGSLEPSAEHDRGAFRLLQQTVFLASAFERFERAVGATGLADEHLVRSRALSSPVATYRHVIVTVADQAADAHGLWTADFDLLSRLPLLERIEIVATESILATGFHERLHDLVPEIEQDRRDSVAIAPALIGPAHVDRQPHQVCIYRDREEELAAFARAIRQGSAGPGQLEQTAVVFQRPLPYLYLARQVFADASLPYQALDALPLAAEPFAAAVDLMFTAIAADFTRAALVELMRCPHFSFGVAREEVVALDRYLFERKYLGSIERLRSLASESMTNPNPKHSDSALAAAVRVATLLVDAVEAPSAPEQIGLLLRFVIEHEVQPQGHDEWHTRHLRARAAVLSAFEMLRDAHAAHDTEPLRATDLAGAVRRWIEGQTFSPRLGSAGVMLMDSTAAQFADLDETRIVGLVDGDWPERTDRSIFYPQSLLAQLGWPPEQQRLQAARARFQDLLRLARQRVTLSAFTLEDDALVSPSSLLDEVSSSGLRLESMAPVRSMRVFAHEALMGESSAAVAVSDTARQWLELRRRRSCEGARFKGSAGVRQPTAYAVSHVERYLNCPFKYFAAYVLKLPEEREEQAWMTPQERGQFIHEVFEEFFIEWQRLGHGAITAVNVREAIDLFGRIAEGRLGRLAEGDRALERTLLLGSAAASGLAERAFGFEIEQDAPVVERLLEYELRDTFEFSTGDTTRQVAIRAKADRIDLLEDGSLRIVDYKLGRAPNRDRALQLPVYGACAAQALDGRHGRSWNLSRAGYVAFKEKQPFVSLGKTQEELDKALAEGRDRLCAAVDGIERGEFPVQPDEPYLCTWCAYSTVCRKDYVGDE